MRYIPSILSSTLVSLALCGTGPVKAQTSDPFNPVIPRAQSSAKRLSTRDECREADDRKPETFFGITIGNYYDAGATVDSVDSNGPARDSLVAGDVIVSINGIEFVDDRLSQDPDKGHLIQDPFENLAMERGIYVYGIRDGDVFETIIWSCAGEPKQSPFVSQDTQRVFIELYPETAANTRNKARDRRLILAAFFGAKYGHVDKTKTKNKYAPTTVDGYCALRPSTRVQYTETQTSWKETYYGSRYNEQVKTTDRSIRVDSALHHIYSANFDFIHHNTNITIPWIQIRINDLVDSYGCASPEFKDLERRVYRLFGQNW